MTLAVSIAQIGSNNVSFRNRIINGAMVIDQRNAGAALSVTTGVFTIDRWVGASSGGTTTFQRIASGTTGFSNAIQIKPLTSVTLSTFYQRIESNNCQDLASATVTVSGQIYIDNASGVTCTLYIGIPSAADNYTTTNYLTGQTITLTGGSYVSFSKTFSLTSSGSNGLEVNFQFSSAVGKTIQLTGVQLEAGSTASPFEYRSYGVELMLCQRYYQQSYAVGLVAGDTSGLGLVGGTAMNNGTNNAGNNGVPISFKVPMRATATVTTYAAFASSSASITIAKASTASATYGATADTISSNGFKVFSTATGSGGTAGTATEFLLQYIASAEL